MKSTFFRLVPLICMLQGCEEGNDARVPLKESSKVVLPDVIDLMEYHNGIIKLQGEEPELVSLVDYGKAHYGDLGVQYAAEEKSEHNAYSLILTLDGKKIELVLPNVGHPDFRGMANSSEGTDGEGIQ